ATLSESPVALRKFEKSSAAHGTPTVGADISRPASIDAPQVPGVPLGPEAAERAAGVGFLGEARQLLPSDVSEILGRKDVPADGLPDFDLSSRSFDVNEIRRDFPILQERVNGRPLIWSDTAAPTQKPQAVIDRLDHFSPMRIPIS